MKIDFLIPNKFASHVVMCLMQGFHALGHEIFTNVPIDDLSYSRGISSPFSVTSKDFLQITESLVHDILIVDASLGLGGYEQAVFDIASKRYRPVVLVNMQDESNFKDYPEEYLVFCAHQNIYATRFGRIFPIGFGLSEDIIIRSNAVDLGHKSNAIVRNFFPSFSQSVRNSLDLALVEGLEKYFEVDKRHTDADAYLTQLTSVGAVCAYGGEFMPDFRDHPYLNESWKKSGDTRYHFRSFEREMVVLRWDSWRFFEAAVMGCAPIHMDFEKYGMRLPVNPVAWESYIPVDMASVSDLAAKLHTESQKDNHFIQKIGAGAREWVIANYAPKSQAAYVLDIVQKNA